MGRGVTRVTVGVTVAAVALAGWLVTLVAVSFAARPAGPEDLTAAWTAAGATPLGDEAAVTVPAGATLVAFLVGTDLRGIAGTTTGSCTAESDGARLPLDWPVHIDPSLTGVLADRQETVPIAGWPNDRPRPAAVRIACRSADSGVDHFVAVPSGTARLESHPWFQPWGWLVLGVAGAAITAAGARRR